MAVYVNEGIALKALKRNGRPTDLMAIQEIRNLRELTDDMIALIHAWDKPSDRGLTSWYTKAKEIRERQDAI